MLKFTECKWPMPESSTSVLYLRKDNWDDFGFQTLYELRLFDSEGQMYDLGYCKIATIEGEEASLPDECDSLPNNLFSLGQSTEYYEIMHSINPKLRDYLLEELNDVVNNSELRNSIQELKIFRISFLRGTSITTIKEQYRRILSGGETKINYNFEYELYENNTSEGYKLSFSVEPNSTPPSNVHVLIGSNGIGKTYLLKNMVKSLINEDNEKGEFKQLSNNKFSGVVSVSYSAFDSFKPYKSRNGFPYSYLGLKKDASNNISLKNIDDLAEDFYESLNFCFNVGRKETWLKSIKLLESDLTLSGTIFFTLDIVSDENKQIILDNFRRLSSGHAIILLTITRLIEKVEEKTLVILDEPESHLHPPLVATFIRILSNILREKNAVAIIATHTPIILQEVSKNCVWKISRFGSSCNVERSRVETYGETIEKLTHEIFNLEIKKTGFYKDLSDDVNNNMTYENIISKYNNQLGFEARLLLRTLINNRSISNDSNS